ncbi:MAG: ABC transporter ATP-binding protein [Dehalococcoidia bacterium]
MGDRLLEVKNLKTYFYIREGELRAVDELSYTVNKGQFVSLVGESACGKSVSALSIMRLIPYPPGIIVGGEIIFDGKDLLRLSEEEMRSIRGNRIAMIFQEPMTSLNPVLTVGRQISEALEIHRGLSKKDAIEEAVKLLKLVGIPDADRRVNDYPYQFSGGMQQRIMIAMAISCKPALLIADEPTTSVDVTVQAQLMELIDNLRKEFDTSVVLITHNLGLVARYADHVNVMYAGRLVESGSIDVIYSQPLHPYTMGLIASVPRLDSQREQSLRVIPGLPPNLIRLPQDICAFAARCPFTLGSCIKARPELEQMEGNHFVACFRHNETKALAEAET